MFASNYPFGRAVRDVVITACDADQVRRVAEENGVDVSSQISELEQRAQQVCYFGRRFRRCAFPKACDQSVG